MLHILRARLHQQYRTYPFPAKRPILSQRYTGRPVIKTDGCVADCSACATVCPSGAISRSNEGRPVIDLGRCILCRACETACKPGLISFSDEFSMSVSKREDLIVKDAQFKVNSGRSVLAVVMPVKQTVTCWARRHSISGVLAYNLSRRRVMPTVCW